MISLSSIAIIVFLPNEVSPAMTLPLLFNEYERQKMLKPRKAPNANTLSKLY